MIPQARNRWVKLWRDAGAKGDSEPAFGVLVERYSESHRAYHNLAHVLDCLDEFESARQLARNDTAVALALWYHDIVYDPRAKDNEERSAELANEALNSAGLAQETRESITALILSTKKHDGSLDLDAPFMVDVDLSILGREPARFDEYESQIRQEYSWVPEDAFVNGRSAILESFLARTVLYGTEFFRAKYERQARENLRRSIQQLRL